ncbi:Laccase domain protein YfiH [Hartmannibacter diazotrophicus]|uniref:Purine nucleoside phosphorylase n=1 Tax=Hartmannibacter diazotrophicus TaxID=1482074 RepID=A0A2C9DA07_9HYPH|nr:peptidoglycan editing factor PgeF [Hartmannibacter diazotrophicus]SON57063.1 Laccase domain protein YfiH [Hartmannibacter diazotrophicus]
MIVQSEELAALPGIRHGFFTRQGGVSDGIYGSLNTGLGSSDEREKVVENRARIARELGVEPQKLVSAYQIHSPDCLVVTTPWSPEDNPKADALVTKTPGIAVGASSADCGPILFADPKARVVGAAHSGWKGAFTGVLESAVETMETEGADRAAIVAVIGPMISAAAYEVGPEFVARFEEQDADNGRFFSPSERPGHAMFDLPGYIEMRLARASVGTVVNLRLCTYSDPARFYSYRRMTHRGEADYGRHLSAIALVD